LFEGLSKIWKNENKQILNLWNECLFFTAAAMQIHRFVPGMEWSGWRQQ